MGVRELMYLVFGLAVINGFIGSIAVNSFLSGTKAISSGADLERFRAMVRQQMYQALGQIVLLGGGIILGVAGLLTGRVGLLLVLALNGLVLIMGVIGRGAEARARSLPVEDPALAAEYRRVCESWLHRPLPNF